LESAQKTFPKSVINYSNLPYLIQSREIAPSGHLPGGAFSCLKLWNRRGEGTNMALGEEDKEEKEHGHRTREQRGEGTWTSERRKT
jgi:hypothetical protein